MSDKAFEISSVPRLIEEEYFDGAPLLFKATREHMDMYLREIAKFIADLSDRAVELLGAIDSDGDATETEKEEMRAYLTGLTAAPVPAPQEVEAGARRQAKNWLTLVQAEVADELGFRAEAIRLAAEVLMEEDDEERSKHLPSAGQRGGRAKSPSR